MKAAITHHGEKEITAKDAVKLSAESEVEERETRWQGPKLRLKSPGEVIVADARA